MVGPAGIYGAFILPIHKDTLTMPNNVSAGISIRLVKNFFLYAGPSFGKVNEESKIGFDFGACYYAGFSKGRMGLQIGYNTLLEAAMVGFRLGLGVY